jgi:hypothetical protein
MRGNVVVLAAKAFEGSRRGCGRCHRWTLLRGRRKTSRRPRTRRPEIASRARSRVHTSRIGSLTRPGAVIVVALRESKPFALDEGVPEAEHRQPSTPLAGAAHRSATRARDIAAASEMHSTRTAGEEALTTGHVKWVGCISLDRDPPPLSESRRKPVEDLGSRTL